eukprot:CAMPEP_0178379510 /NCGR_PEP_ID=MMETSP0689_2-20121128/4979_1 /TAXON_ID=160604 /ORGANISM="Amphidinium massartii, Strain CS-259" /LENGTH=32 /DNA_ID= /DNA_START= /DNA_END= /DNA_ORIENTATION=
MAEESLRCYVSAAPSSQWTVIAAAATTNRQVI